MAQKKYSIELKEKVIKEALEVGNASEIARKYQLLPNEVCRWVNQYRKYGQVGTNRVMSPKWQIIADPEQHKRVIEENVNLKKMLEEKELELAILKDILGQSAPPPSNGQTS